jgi:hypothetical protein
LAPGARVSDRGAAADPRDEGPRPRFLPSPTSGGCAVKTAGRKFSARPASLQVRVFPHPTGGALANSWRPGACRGEDQPHAPGSASSRTSAGEVRNAGRKVSGAAPVWVGRGPGLRGQAGKSPQAARPQDMPAPGQHSCSTSVGEVKNAGRKASVRPTSLQVTGVSLTHRPGAAEVGTSSRRKRPHCRETWARRPRFSILAHLGRVK